MSMAAVEGIVAREVEFPKVNGAPIIVAPRTGAHAAGYDCAMTWSILPALMFAFLLGAGAGAHAVTQEEVLAGAEKTYRERVTELDQAGMLDVDPAFLARVARIARRLSEQAQRDHPAIPALAWEIHTSSDDRDNASCMAGGKILLSQAYVERLMLNDAELAMILSHEMQHAILLHNLKEYEEAIRLEPAWRTRPFAELEDAVDYNDRLMTRLIPINREQEIEADRRGLEMAWRAGWRALDLAGYFRKVVQSRSMSNFGSATHPAPTQRWRTARALATALDQTPPPATANPAQ